MVKRRKTKKRKGGSFGSYRIKVDDNLSKVTGAKKGSKLKPSEMTKKMWSYIKRKKLGSS